MFELPEAIFTAIVFRSNSAASVALSNSGARRTCCLDRRTWRRQRACETTAPRCRPDSSKHRQRSVPARIVEARRNQVLHAEARILPSVHRRAGGLLGLRRHGSRLSELPSPDKGTILACVSECCVCVPSDEPAQQRDDTALPPKRPPAPSLGRRQGHVRATGS